MRAAAALVAWLVAALAADVAPAGLRSVTIAPGQDLCAAIRALEPGVELMLAPGDHPAGCGIRRGGAPGAPVVIRAADLAARPRLVYEGTRSNVLDIRADHVLVRGLRFGPTQADVDAIRIYANRGVTVEDCEFSEIRGIPLVANHISLRGLTVQRNTFLDSRSTAMYFGCHDGAACAVTDAVIERNYVRRTGVGPDGVAFGLQIKLNSAAVVRDNVIAQPRGPGIMVYGARDPQRTSLVERNVVHGSAQSAGIVIGGGPVVVRNNVSTGNAEGGLLLEDYGRRGLLRQISIVHNTVYGNSRGGIVLRGGVPHDVVIANNAVHVNGAPIGWGLIGWGRGRAWPEPGAGVAVTGNVDCSTGPSCFADPEVRNFSPTRVLAGAGVPRAEVGMPSDDLLGVRRGTPPTVGALERAADPIPDGSSRPRAGQ
jgi:nitrous oxidase accessory protein NosD